MNISELLDFFCLFSRLRQCSRNILHVNVFLVFLIRSAIQFVAELRMSTGYFPHNVFHRTDACNRTHIYFKEDQVNNSQFKKTKFSLKKKRFFFVLN